MASIETVEERPIVINREVTRCAAQCENLNNFHIKSLFQVTQIDENPAGKLIVIQQRPQFLQMQWNAL